jgi:tRNA-specific 2-thiouridylase
VRVQHGPQGSRLLRGLDPAKDQSYFLWGLPREILPRLLFPVGELTKAEVRERARGLLLPTAEKPESQEICFVPTGDYRDLLKRTLRTRHPALEPGRLVLEDGTDMGGHDGYAGFTVGQRKGLGGGFPEPMYVLQIRADTREVVIGPREALYSGGVRVARPHWLLEPPAPGAEVRVQIRYRAPAVRARVAEHDAESIELVFEEPQSAVSPGQSAVLFRDDVVLGGGRITSGIPATEASPPL